jgi:hypothetical protein
MLGTDASPLHPLPVQSCDSSQQWVSQCQPACVHNLHAPHCSEVYSMRWWGCQAVRGACTVACLAVLILAHSKAHVVIWYCISDMAVQRLFLHAARHAAEANSLPQPRHAHSVGMITQNGFHLIITHQCPVIETESTLCLHCAKHSCCCSVLLLPQPSRLVQWLIFC